MCLTKLHAMKEYRWMGILLHAFLTSALDGHERSALCPCCLATKEKPSSTHRTVVWVSLSAGLEAPARNLISVPESSSLEHCHYTDSVIWAHRHNMKETNKSWFMIITQTWITEKIVQVHKKFSLLLLNLCGT